MAWNRTARKRLLWIPIVIVLVLAGIVTIDRVGEEAGPPGPRERATGGDRPAEVPETTPAADGKESSPVRARATDPEGEPVAGVQVEVAGLRMSTDDRGEATFELAPGPYRIGVPDPAWWGASDPFTVPTEETVRVHVSRGWRLRVVVTDEGGGPVAGARVDVWSPGDGTRKATRTDGRGVARIGACGWCDSLPVHVTSESHLAASFSVEPPDEADGEVVRRVTLLGGDPLEILVLEEDRTPVPHAHLYIVHRSSQQVYMEADENGAAVVPGVVAPPSVHVRASARDGRRVNRDMPVSPESRGLSVVLTMPPGRKFEGLVVRADGGAPVEGAELHLGDGWGRWMVAAISGPAGRFRIARGPGEGDYCDLWVTAPELAARQVDVKQQDSGNLRIELSPAGRVRGRVTDADGEPVAGVEVSNREHDSQRGVVHGRTDAGGWFDLPGVPPGDGWLRLEREGYPEDARYFDGLEPGQTQDLGEVRMARVFTLRARVVDEPGRPVARGWVEGCGVVRAVKNGRFAPLVLDRTGEDISFGGPGFLTSRHHRVSAEAKELVLLRGCYLRGRLTRKETGQPVTDVDVVLRALSKDYSDHSGWLATVRTDDWGYFEASGLQRGRFEIRVATLGLRGEIEIEAREQNAGTIALDVSGKAVK